MSLINWLKRAFDWFTGSQKARPTLNQCAQTAHLFAGSFCVYTGLVLFHALWEGWVFVAVFTTWKEAWRDPRAEGDPYFWDGAEDQGFWLIGAALSTVIIELSRRL